MRLGVTRSSAEDFDRADGPEHRPMPEPTLLDRATSPRHAYTKPLPGSDRLRNSPRS
jgi:hypothetical protein